MSNSNAPSASSKDLFAKALTAKAADAPVIAANATAPAVTVTAVVAQPAPVEPASPAPAPVAAAVPATPAPPVVQEVEEPVTQVTELDMLKSRAKLMNIDYSNNIGVDALKAKIQAKLDGEADKEEEEAASEAPVVQAETPAAGELKVDAVQVIEPVKSLRQTLYEREMKLIRLRITNLNPNKKDLPGEIFTFGNRILGSVKKYIPYGEATENGYHVPFCIYKQLKEREFLNIKTRKDSRGRQIVETAMAREFALEIMDPLTERELARLAASQAAAAGQD